jgi:hypothetical protein
MAGIWAAKVFLMIEITSGVFALVMSPCDARERYVDRDVT